MNSGTGKVRIIAGQWRGRRLPVADLPGLRPTADRMRETLFNWLMPVLPGARCLDLFAGSGALGLEAASRGAALSVLVENQPAAVRQLRQVIETLKADTVQLVKADALQFLRAGPQDRPFDIVFLDPPFASELLLPACQSLEQYAWLQPQAHIYLEMPRAQALAEDLALPANWRIVRRQQSRDSACRLARVF